MDKEAEKRVKLSQKKLLLLVAAQEKKNKRIKAYQKRVDEAEKEDGEPDAKTLEARAKIAANEKAEEGGLLGEGGEIEMQNFYNTSSDEEYDLDNFSDPGSSCSQKDRDIMGSDSDSSPDDMMVEGGGNYFYEGGCFGGSGLSRNKAIPALDE